MRQGWSVVVWPVTLTAPAPGTKVYLPSGFVDRTFLNVRGLSWNEIEQTFIESISGAELVMLARPPKLMGTLEKTTATITVRVNATSYRLTIAGAKLGPKDKIVSRTDIVTFANPTGQEQVTIANADRFRDEQGRFVFSLRVERLQQAEGGAGFTASSVAKWQFNDIKVDLKGTVR